VTAYEAASYFKRRLHYEVSPLNWNIIPIMFDFKGIRKASPRM